MTNPALALRLPWQDAQWQHIHSLLQTNKLPHALLLSGPPGTGKQRFAMALAQYLICESPVQGGACGQCRQCGFTLAGFHPDLQWLSPEEKSRQIKIDQIRELVQYLGHTSQQGGYKVAVLAPAEAMNANAANALLKSLEEPAANTLLLLLTDAPGQILPTVRSRCQKIVFPLPSQRQSKNWLSTLVPSSISVEQLLLEAAGQPMTALGLLENDGLNKRQQLSKDFGDMLSGAISGLTLAEKWQGYDLIVVSAWVAQQLTALISFKMAASGDNKNEALTSNVIRQWSNTVDCRRLFTLFDKANNLLNNLNRGANPNRQLALEELLLDCCEKNHS